MLQLRPARARKSVPTTVAGALGLALIGLALSGCGGSDEAAAAGRYTVTVGVSGEESFEGKLAYQVARANGYFEAEGVKIKDVLLSGSGAAALQPLVGGQVNVAYLSLSTALQAVAQGEKVKLGASTQKVNSWAPAISTDYLRKKGIDPKTFASWPTEQRWAAIKGSKWAATTAGGLNARAIGYLAKHFGLDPEKDIQIAAIPGLAATLATLESGKVDGFMASTPENVTLVEEGTIVLVQTRDELAQQTPVISHARGAELIINDEWFAANPDAAKAFFTAYQKGADFVTAHSSQEVAEALIKIFPDYDVARATALVEEEKSNVPEDSKASIESLQDQVTFALETGAIPTAVNVEDTYQFSYLPAPNPGRTDW